MTGRPASGHLAEPLSEVERREIGRLYVVHQGLIRLLGHKLCRKYPLVDRLEIYSCIDISFIKACRAYDPRKGAFSTIFSRFALGEVRHFIRDRGYSIKMPRSVKELGSAVRRLAARGYSVKEISETLGVSTTQIREAVLATSGLLHEQLGWEQHQCPRQTPWELLEESEAS